MLTGKALLPLFGTILCRSAFAVMSKRTPASQWGGPKDLVT